MRKINVAGVPRRQVVSPKGTFVEERREISPTLDVQKNPSAKHPFGIEMVTLPPGKRFLEHESYVVVSGHGEVRHPGGNERQHRAA